MKFEQSNQMYSSKAELFIIIYFYVLWDPIDVDGEPQLDHVVNGVQLVDEHLVIA